MNKKDLQSLRRILRHIPTADPALQKEILRLDAILEHMLKPRKDQ